MAIPCSYFIKTTTRSKPLLANVFSDILHNIATSCQCLRLLTGRYGPASSLLAPSSIERLAFAVVVPIHATFALIPLTYGASAGRPQARRLPAPWLRVAVAFPFLLVIPHSQVDLSLVDDLPGHQNPPVGCPGSLPHFETFAHLPFIAALNGLRP